MDLGTAPLFDLTAPVAATVDEPAVAVRLTRSQELLSGIRDDEQVIADREIAKLRKIAEWALEHTVTEDSGDAATITEHGWDTGLPVAGPGAPLISDFAVMELSALLGRSYDSGRAYVGQVVELAHRLPKTWTRVLSGEVPVWKARRIARLTIPLIAEAVSRLGTQPFNVPTTSIWPQMARPRGHARRPLTSKKASTALAENAARAAAIAKGGICGAT